MLAPSNRFPPIVVWLFLLRGFLAVPGVRAAQPFKACVLAKIPDTPEGLAVDSKGNLYATLLHLGEVVMIRDDGTYEHIAWIPLARKAIMGM